MSGWIKFWKDMPNDPRVLAAAIKLSDRYQLSQRTDAGGIDLTGNALCNAWRNAVVGALATLWCYADEHIRDDDTLPLTSQTLDAVVGLEGFFDVMPREWIDELDDGSITLPGYCEKNSLIAKRKRTAKSNARVTQWRRRKGRVGNGVGNDVGNGVTSAHVTQHNAAGDLDQDLDKDIRNTHTPRTRAHAQDDIRKAFLEFKDRYPKFAGRQDWIQVEHFFNLRVERGITIERLLAAADRYRAYVDGGGVSNSAFVMTPKKFLSEADEPWNQPWDLPKALAKPAQSAADKITWRPSDEPAAGGAAR